MPTMANSPSTELPTRNDPELLIERQKGDQHNWPIVLGDTLVLKPVPDATGSEMDRKHADTFERDAS